MTLVDAISERDFQKQIEDALTLFSWRWVHFRTSIGHKGRYQTAMRGNKGFPDIMAVRSETVIYAELKSEKGTLSDDQRAWADDLRDAGETVYCWHPSDIDSIIEILR